MTNGAMNGASVLETGEGTDMTAKSAHLRGVNDIPARVGPDGRSEERAPRKAPTYWPGWSIRRHCSKSSFQVWTKQKATTEHRLQLVQTQIATAAESLRKAQSATPVQRPSHPKPRSVAVALARPKRRADVVYSF